MAPTPIAMVSNLKANFIRPESLMNQMWAGLPNYGLWKTGRHTSLEEFQRPPAPASLLRPGLSLCLCAPVLQGDGALPAGVLEVHFTPAGTRKAAWLRSF